MHTVVAAGRDQACDAASENRWITGQNWSSRSNPIEELLMDR